MTWFSESGGSQAQYLQVCKCFSSHSQHQVLVLLPWRPLSYDTKAVFSAANAFYPHAVSSLLLLTQNPAFLSTWPDHGLQTRTLTYPNSKRCVSRSKSILHFHAVSSFQNAMNEIWCLMIFAKTWRIQIHQDKLIKKKNTPGFTSVINHRPPRRSIRPFLPCQQVSVKVVPTHPTTPRKSSCERESKGHQLCILLNVCFWNVTLGNYIFVFIFWEVLFFVSYCLCCLFFVFACVCCFWLLLLSRLSSFSACSAFLSFACSCFHCSLLFTFRSFAAFSTGLTRDGWKKKPK